MSQDFKNAKIYKITNDYNDDVYVGSTCNTLVRRFSVHKCDARKHNDRALYKLINELGDSRFRIELIENYPCEDKYQLIQREGHFIRLFGTLNMKIAGRTDAEYHQDNKEKINEKNREYKKITKIKLNNIILNIKKRLNNIIKFIEKKMLNL